MLWRDQMEIHMTACTTRTDWFVASTRERQSGFNARLPHRGAMTRRAYPEITGTPTMIG
jgi:hypothetical protein